MRFGLSLPNRGDYGDIHLILELAALAEESGWDGFFLWDHVASGVAPHLDPWTSIAAIATITTRLRLGVLITPLSRRRPWKVAREIVTIDKLSNGRVILGVGLGDFQKKEFEGFGEVGEPRNRGEMLDEALEIINGLQSGEPFSFEGKHYRMAKTLFQPTPIQKPRVPIWVAGSWPNKPPFRRAAQWDGVVPVAKGRGKKDFLMPDEIRQMMDYIWQFRTSDTRFDVCLSGVTGGQSPSEDMAVVEPYREVGVTWWIEFVYSGTGTVKKNKERIRLGPPRG